MAEEVVIYKLNQSQSSGTNWKDYNSWDPVPTTEPKAFDENGIYYVETPASETSVNGYILRTEIASVMTFGPSLYLGYSYDTASKTFSPSDKIATLALKDLGGDINFTDLHLGNAQILAWGSTLNDTSIKGKIYLESESISITNQYARLELQAQIYGTSDTVLNLYCSRDGAEYKFGDVNVDVTTRYIDCPVVLHSGLFGSQAGSYGDNFSLTLKDGTAVKMYDNYIGKSGTYLYVEGSVSWYHEGTTSASKVNKMETSIPSTATLNITNPEGDGARGSVIFNGNIDGSGKIVVSTAGKTNTNRLTISHSENTFTGTISVETGELSFYDNKGSVLYCSTNALINATAISVASGAMIDVYTTTQTFKNISGKGEVHIGDDTNIGQGTWIVDTSVTDLTFEGTVTGTGNLTKASANTFTLTQAPQYIGDTTINAGKLTLSAGGTLYNLSGTGTLDTDDDLTVNVRENQTKKFVGVVEAENQTITKDGSGTFQLYVEKTGDMKATNVAVNSGRMDFKGYYEGSLEVNENGTFSPGNSVGELEITKGNLTLNDTAIALFEFDGFDTTKFDNVTLSDGDFAFDTNSIIQITFDKNDAKLWAADENAKYYLVNDAGNTTEWSTLPTLSDASGLFKLGGDVNGLYLCVKPIDPSASVPEPSTWALLVLGTAGIYFIRRRHSKK